MSDGMKYLAALRPEAMTGLLQFYGKSAQALDDKTRFLIAVVTKVAVGTERGLRQYAPRAIRAGASKEELLDAVLMAFPAAGLSQVIAAVEVLLEMGLLPAVPGEAAATSALETPISSPTEIDLGPSTAFPLERLKRCDTESGAFLVYRKQDTLKVYLARCPHRGGELLDDSCKDGVIECPAHHWRFRLDDGCNLKAGATGLTVVPSAVRDGRVVVENSPAPAR